MVGLEMEKFFEINLRELSFKYLFYTLGIIMMLEFIKLCFLFKNGQVSQD